ncbi:MAG: hypothetical protein GY928_38985 [Colwellia sp.]|nr:hypothetical protein [Colwellia sp.]
MLQSTLNGMGIYPSRFEMQDSAGTRTALDEALIEDNSYSIVEINNDV